MKQFLLLFFLAFSLLSGGCSNGQATSYSLEPKEFAEKIAAAKDAALIDVRTPAEFSKGHLSGAKNINWNGDDFEKQISQVDKNKPVFVYCLSGGRSGAAAEKMRSEGYKEVYEMNGGMMSWRHANLPETTDNAGPIKTATGMSLTQFQALFNSDKIVLIDFYADWCVPCKKMKPYLEEIGHQQADNVIVVRINADENPELCKTLNIDGLPYLQVYKNKTLVWSNKGYVEKAEVVSHL